MLAVLASLIMLRQRRVDPPLPKPVENSCTYIKSTIAQQHKVLRNKVFQMILIGIFETVVTMRTLLLKTKTPPDNTSLS